MKEMKSILSKVNEEFLNSDYWRKFFQDKELFDQAVEDDFYGVDELLYLQDDLKNRMN